MQVSQGPQTEPVCYKLCCRVKWVIRETNFPYLYLFQHYVLQCRSKTGGKITGVATPITLKFDTIPPIYKNKKSAASNQKFPLLFKGNLLNNHQKKVKIGNILLKGRCNCTSCSGSIGCAGTKLRVSDMFRHNIPYCCILYNSQFNSQKL